MLNNMIMHIIVAQNMILYQDKAIGISKFCLPSLSGACSIGCERAYIADFEVYDERSHDHNNVTLDIYIGI